MEDSSFGFGVRVIVDVAWGFAASPVVTQEEIANITKEAAIIAKANAAIQPKPIQLAPVKAYRDHWATPFDKDPFDVPMAEKPDLMRRATEQVKKNPKVFSGAAGLTAISHEHRCEEPLNLA
jgi:TldD protein